MAITLKTEEGLEFSFDTVEELMDFQKQMDEKLTSKEDDISEDEEVVPENEPKFEVGDKVRVVENTSGGHDVGTIGEISVVRYVNLGNRWSYVVRPIYGPVFEYSLSHKEADLELLETSEDDLEVGDKVRVVSAEDGTSTSYHGFKIGSIGEVTDFYENGKLEVYNGTFSQTLLPHHYEKMESLGKDANGEDLYKGDFVTGTEDNDYGYTNDEVVMEVLGAGESVLFREANIIVRIVGHSGRYRVDSSEFVKLSDNLDDAKDKFDEIKGEGYDSERATVGDSVELVKPIKVGPFEVEGTVGMRATVVEDDGEDYRPLEISMEKSFSDESVEIPKDSTVYVEYEDVKVVEEEQVIEDEQEFKVGDKVRVVGNSHGHLMATGELREIKDVDSEEPKYNLSEVSNGFWAGTTDIEPVDSSPKFQSGDVVKVTESFEDITGDRVKSGAVYNYDEITGLGESFVGTVFLGDNVDKLELVCRAQDRLDK